MAGNIRITIAMKVGSLVTVLVAVILILLFHSIISIRTIHNDLMEISALDVPLTEIANEMEIAQLEQHILMDEVIRKQSLGGKNTGTKEKITELSTRIRELTVQGIALASRGAATNDSEIFGQIYSSLNELKEKHSRIDNELKSMIRSLLSENSIDMALVADILKKDEAFDRQAIEVVRAIEGLTNRKTALTIKHEQLFSKINISLGSIGVVLGVVLGTLIVMGIKTNILRLSKRIGQVTQAVKEDGDISVDEEDEIHSSDEFGELSKNLSSLIESVSDDIDKRNKQSKHLTKLATTDPLTNSYNRHKWEEAHQIEIKKAQALGIELSLIVFDIDHFKNVNDTYGHDIGDSTLVSVVNCASSVLRSMDTVYRIGGEEFAILLPHTSLDNAVVLAERVRKNIADHSFKKVGKITVSLGLTCLNGTEDDSKQFIKRADEALYCSKKSGRNKVSVG